MDNSEKLSLFRKGNPKGIGFVDISSNSGNNLFERISAEIQGFEVNPLFSQRVDHVWTGKSYDVGSTVQSDVATLCHSWSDGTYTDSATNKNDLLGIVPL